MKKNIAITALSIISVLSVTYGYYQKKQADENETRALESELVAKKMTLEAERQMEIATYHKKIAEMNAREAKRQEQLSKSK